MASIWPSYTTFAIVWWRHQMETFSALLALCEGNPPVTGGFPSQKPVTRIFDVFFDLRLNKRPNGWANNWDADDLRRNGAHYDVTVMARNCRDKWGVIVFINWSQFKPLLGIFMRAKPSYRILQRSPYIHGCVLRPHHSQIMSLRMNNLSEFINHQAFNYN